MAGNQSWTLKDLGKIVTVTGVTLGLNYLLQHYILHKPIHDTQPTSLNLLPSREKHEENYLKRNLRVSIFEDLQPKGTSPSWGNFLIEQIGKGDAILEQLRMMSEAMCALVKVRNLIVDLQLRTVVTFPCPLLATHPKRNKDEPFLNSQALVHPGEFVIENCAFKIGQEISCEKKFLRAGPRATQYFNSQQVRADIVVCGKVVPGVNNLIKELVYLLKSHYKVESVTGVRFSFKGYYDQLFLQMTDQLVRTIHHKGGCFLGVSPVECHPDRIVESLVERGINQVYIIGGNDTYRYADRIYEEIRSRKLNIAVGVPMKAINKDIPFFDTCFGFESVVEQTEKFIEHSYALCKSNYNSAGLVKVPGNFSGFLAMDAVRAARNANVCLVPEFPFELYGKRGLLSHIADCISAKGYCIVVYSEGARNAVVDVKFEKCTSSKVIQEPYAFDKLLKSQIENILTARNYIPHNVITFDAREAVRSVPANSFDTKLCSQIALCVIQCMMCGYTDFAVGHIKNRVAMIPIKEMINSKRFHLKLSDENWQRLLANTGQPSFLNQDLEMNPLKERM